MKYNDDMTQNERLSFLIQYLLNERNEYKEISIPASPFDKRRLLRGLMNVRPPIPADKKFLEVQDAYLSELISKRGVTNITHLSPICRDIYLWQGDITTLAVDAIVNAANNGMLGCFIPCHGCIDNAIHTYAGVQLRMECASLMSGQKEEPAGKARITNAYNLPCRYVLHTVGPIIYGKVTRKDQEVLACCYRSCLELAKENDLHSLAFCCISTGEFHFPRELAAQIAVWTVCEWQKQNPNKIKVVFNVFKDSDYEIYERLLR